MSGPIKPKEVQEQREASIPEEVFEVFNDLIKKNWSGHSATVMQGDAAHLICQKLNITSTKLYENGWMDVENAYRKAGWKVEYDKPGYNETYEANYRFTKK
jgi:hypothetical protein